jgi:ABC-type glycerol-3-phosphate transport system substrate-binding protein
MATPLSRVKRRTGMAVGILALTSLAVTACSSSSSSGGSKGSSGSSSSSSGGSSSSSTSSSSSSSKSGGGGSGGGTVHLTYGTNGTPVQLAAEQKVLTAFEKANPKIAVTLQSIPFDSYDTKMTTSLRAKNGPDVFRVNHTDVQAWTDAGFLAPLTSANLVTSELIPGLVSAGQVKGKQYTVPMDTDARALYYNPALLKKAKISGAPTTWAQLLSDASTVKSATGAYGFAYRADSDYAMAYETVGPLMKTAQGAILTNSSGKASATAGTNAGTISAVTFLQSLVKAHVTPPGQSTMNEDTMDQLFAKGKLAFMMGGPWERPTIVKDEPSAKYGTDLATAPIPVPKVGDKTASTSGGWQLGVAAASSKRTAAFTLLNYIEHPANLESIAASGTFPPTKTGLDNAPWKSDPFYDAFKTELPQSGLPILPVPQLAQVAAAFEKNVAPAVLSGGSAQAALAAFDKQVNQEVLR